MRWAGRAKRKAIAGTRLWPPARTRPSSGASSASSAIAESSAVGAWYVKGAGFMAGFSAEGHFNGTTQGSCCQPYNIRGFVAYGGMLYFRNDAPTCEKRPFRRTERAMPDRTSVLSPVTYRDGVRGWLEQVEHMGELLRVNGAHWDTEMGAITHMLTEKSHGTAPAILFDDVPGYPKGFRTLYGHFSSVGRVGLSLGLPLKYERKVDIVKQYFTRMQEIRSIPPRYVERGPILENVLM